VRLHGTLGLAGRGDGYQCGLDWGRSRVHYIDLYSPTRGSKENTIHTHI